MPPIYLNIVNVALDDSAEEADSLLEIAKEIAAKYSQERLFDIETRHSLSYYNRGDFDRFLEGYKAYKEGLAKGYSTVHGRSMEVYYLACTGEVDKAVAMARKELGDEGVDVIPLLYERSGRWEDAYKALKKSAAVSDSIDNVIIINSMQGIRDEISLYESKVEEARYKLIGLSAIILLLSLLIIALVYIVQTRRRHLKELQKAYNRAMESENMKAAFIRNISHEIRTPLNIISGFSQVIADPELTDSVEERQHMAGMIQTNAHHVTTLLDEIIGLSLIESTHMMSRNDELEVNKALREKLEDYESVVQEGVKLNYQTSLSDDFTILTNANMFTRIINCLLENAAKYTTKGSITLSASRDDQILSIIVEDTGCGIPVEEAEHIFERFVKLDNFKEGIGLGLPLSRKLAEQLGGTVAFDKSYSNGARFIVDLPITKIPAK
jgi:signal transduction histidine kinase